MTSLEERKKQQALSNAYLAGELIFDIKFRHNSHVEFQNSNGDKTEGWIVSVGPVEPEPIYTIEQSDGSGDTEVPESKLTLLFDPHAENDT